MDIFKAKLKGMKDLMRRYNIGLTDVSKKKKKNRKGVIFKQIVAENFAKLLRQKFLDSGCTTNRINKTKSTLDISQ